MWMGCCMSAGCQGGAPAAEPASGEPADSLRLRFAPAKAPLHRSQHLLMRLEGQPVRSLQVLSTVTASPISPTTAPRTAGATGHDAGPSATAAPQPSHVATTERILRLIARGDREALDRQPKAMSVVTHWNAQHRAQGSPEVRQQGVAKAPPSKGRGPGDFKLAEALGLALRVEFPESTVRVGETWKPQPFSVQEPTVGRLRIAAAFTLTASHAQAGTHEIHADFRITSPRRMLATKLALDVQGGATAVYHVNDRGQVLESRGQLSLLRSVTTEALSYPGGKAVARQHLDASWAMATHPTPAGDDRITAPPLPDPPQETDNCQAALALLTAEAGALPNWKSDALAPLVGQNIRLPLATVLGAPIDQPGPTLLLDRSGPISLDGTPVTADDVKPALAKLRAPHLYVVAPSMARAQDLRPLLQALPASTEVRVIVRIRDKKSAPTPPWLKATYKTLAQHQSVRHTRRALARSFRGTLSLCRPGAQALANLDLDPRRGGVALVQAIQSCGCRRVDVPAVRSLLGATMGGPHLGFEVLPRPFSRRGTLAGMLKRRHLPSR